MLLFFIILCSLMLCYPDSMYEYASTGLEVYLYRMIPTLFPFMVLSGIMIRCGISEKIGRFLSPVLRPIFRVRPQLIYVILTGFVCGFPMGAKVTTQLYEEKRITQKEAEYLLAFCNNLGPVYILGYVLPAIGSNYRIIVLFGMYGIPILYGLILRYTCCRDLNPANESLQPVETIKLFPAIQASVATAVTSILILGGYMIFFNVLLLVPRYLLHDNDLLLSPLLEISAGISRLSHLYPEYCLMCLSFGGLCCLFQTYTCIAETDLGISKYFKHKINQTILAALFYLILFKL